MSRIKQFIHDHSEFSDSDIQSFMHSKKFMHSRHSNYFKKVKFQNFDFLLKFLIFYFLKIK